MKFHISMNDDDYIEFNNFLAFNTKAGKGAITRGRFLGLAISAVIMLVLFIAKADKWLIITEACMLAVFSIAVYVMYPGSVKKSLKKRILKLKEDGKLAYAPESDIEFQDSEIYDVQPDAEKHIPYAKVLSVNEAEDYIYLRMGAQEALVLPKRCLEGRDGELLAFLRERVKTVVTV